MKTFVESLLRHPWAPDDSTWSIRVHLLSFLVFSTATFTRLYRFEKETGESVILYGFDGTIIHTHFQNMLRWREIGTNWGGSPLQGPGHEWFSLNSSLVPWHLLEFLIGQTFHPVFLYLILGTALFLATYVFCRSWGAQRSAALAGAWILPLLSLTYTAPPQMVASFAQNPHWPLQMILAMLATCIFRVSGGRNFPMWAGQATFFVLCLVGVFALSPHRASPLIPFMSSMFLIALLICKTRVDVIAKIGLLVVALIAFKLSGLELFYGTASLRALLGAKVLWSLDNSILPTDGSPLGLAGLQGLGGFKFIYALFVEPFFNFTPRYISEMFLKSYDDVPLIYQTRHFLPVFVGTITLAAAFVFSIWGRRQLRVIGIIFLIFMFYIRVWSYTYYDVAFMPMYALLFGLAFGAFINIPFAATNAKIIRTVPVVAAFLPWLIAFIPLTTIDSRPWPPAETEFISILKSEIEVSENKPFRGTVVNFAGYNPDAPDASAWGNQFLLDNRLNRKIGNDYRFQGLWYFGIPTFVGPNWSPNPFYILYVSKYLNEKPHSAQSWATTWYNKRYLKLAGIRFVISDEQINDGLIERASVSLRVPPDEKMESLRLYEIPDIKIGMSPTRIIRSQSLSEEMTIVETADFKVGEDVVISEDVPFSLSMAKDIQFSPVKDGARVSATAEGKALVVVPMVFSNCLTIEPPTSGVKLMRSNIINTAILFTDKLDIKIIHKRPTFGFNTCSREDVAEVADILPTSSKHIRKYGGYGLKFNNMPKKEEY